MTEIPDKTHLPRELRDLAGDLHGAQTDSLVAKLMYSAADEIDQLRRSLQSVHSYSHGLQSAVDLIAASLALPLDQGTNASDIVRAVRQCVKRCQELEHRTIMAQEDHRQFSGLPADELAAIRERLAALESKR